VGKIAADEDAETVRADDEIGGEGGSVPGRSGTRDRSDSGESQASSRSHGNRHGQFGVVHVARMGRARRKDEVMVPLIALRQDMQRRLDRIVIDECHVILKMKSRFGPKLGELGQLARAETKVILLGATLRRCEEELLWKQMSWRADER
jgi:hypothetical protein